MNLTREWAPLSSTGTGNFGVKQCVDFGFDLADEEGAALHFVEGFHLTEKDGAKEPGQLAAVEFGHKDTMMAGENISGVAGQRIQVAKMGARDGESARLTALYRGEDGAERAAPAENEQIGI